MTDRRFEMGIMVLVVLNMVTMALEHTGMDDFKEEALKCTNYVFLGKLLVYFLSCCRFLKFT